MNRLKVFIIAPYSDGDTLTPEQRVENVERVERVAIELMDNGLIPFAPHLYHYLQEKFPRTWQFWMDQTLEWIRSCEVVLRLPGETAGGERETKLAEAYVKEFYYTTEELIRERGWKRPGGA